MGDSGLLLSICIPTYNRAEYLRECLDSVLLSCQGHAQMVEVLISDNASTDNTPAVTAEYSKNQAPLSYYRNKENVGSGPNFYLAVERAKGEFVWVFGDDDKMAPSAVSTVLELINSDFDLIVANCSVWSRNFQDLIRPRNIRLAEDTTFIDHNNLLSKLGPALGYISSVIVRRSLFLSADRGEYQRLEGTGFSFLDAVYSGVAGHCNARYIATPLILNRGDSPMAWERWDTLFNAGLAAVLDGLLSKGYSREAIASAKRLVLLDYLIPNLMLRKCTGQRLRGLQHLTRANFGSLWPYWALWLPLYMAPTPMLGLIRRTVRYTRALAAARRQPTNLREADSDARLQF
ncbi:MAG: glycosyltransferase family 2 protein [Chloroflexota bacterium]